MRAPTRPLLRYHGGKFRIADWIIGHFPPHETYVEAYAGAASILMRKPRSHVECLNDLEDRVVNLFRVLRDPVQALALRRRLELTPFARSEFNDAYRKPKDAIDKARKTVVLSFMGIGSAAVCRGYRSGFRCKPSTERALPSHDWAGWPAEIPAFVARLRGVAIENREATEVMERLDFPTTLFYVDPPYLHSTRPSSRGRQGYRHEMKDADHERLAEVLHALRGMVVLSGYPSGLYDELYRGWARTERKTMADGASPRVEVLWLNPACALAQRQQRLLA